jgi:hypothetical protein
MSELLSKNALRVHVEARVGPAVLSQVLVAKGCDAPEAAAVTQAGVRT